MFNTSLWQPSVGASWNYYLLNPINLTLVSESPPWAVWGIDLFSNPASTISALQANSSHVICYFSAGSYEDWRPDASNFISTDLGDNLVGWPGERWLNVSSPNVRSIMTRRLDLAASKGCNGVDPDNLDGYSNTNGLGLTQQDSIDYMNFLADETLKRNLSIGLKNANAIIPDLVDRMQWSINEECHHYDECGDFSAFIEQGKPVFNVEYPKGEKTNNNDPVTAEQLQMACNTTDAVGFSTIVKNINLDWFTETCNGTVVTAPSYGSTTAGQSSSIGARRRISIDSPSGLFVYWCIILVLMFGR